MKILISLFAIAFSWTSTAASTNFPAWVTDDRAKIWAVDQLIEFMKDEEFYKIQDIQVVRGFSQENNCDSLDVILQFDDPSCKDREVVIKTLAPLCDEQGCFLPTGLTGCLKNSSQQKNVRTRVLK